MKRVLITGIAGFTGSHLGKYLCSLGLEVYGLDLSPLAAFDQILRTKIHRYYQADIRDKRKVHEIIQSVAPDYLFHLAGLVREDELQKLLEINVIGTQNILEGLKGTKVKVLIPGSAAEYGILPENRLPISEDYNLNPISFYGITKLTQLKIGYHYYLQYGCAVYLPRPFNISGPGEPPNLVCGSIAQKVVEIMRKKTEPVITVGNLQTKRDFVDVRDVVKGYWEIVNKGTPGQVYNICSGNAYSINEVIKIFSEIAKVNLKIKQSPKLMRKIDIPIMLGDNTKIKREIGWSPKIKLEKTLADLLNYYQKRKV
ncbi:MAG: GDP-mannose 4,6-dehydratase [candidate division WOR-3 bacterium]